MQVIISLAAEQDLIEIGDYIADQSPSRAASFVNELLDAALDIGENPRAFPLVPRYERQSVRRRAYKNYLILYAIDDKTLSILRIIHGARDISALLGPDY